MPDVPREDPEGRERPAVEVPSPSATRARPASEARIDSEAFKTIEAAAQAALQRADAADDEHGRDGHGVPPEQRACSATASARPLDSEDGPKGFGAHSDQERILESELYRFTKFYLEVVTTLAKGT